MSIITTYKINESRAMSETLDDETIIINLENGNYYTMNKTGSIIWNKIHEKYSLRQIIEFFTNNYSESNDKIEKSVLGLIEFLKNENLILDSNESESVKPEYDENSKKKFIKPSIERYDDMQEMLLADPIHDVQEEGWPMIKSIKA